MVRAHLLGGGGERHKLIGALAQISGHPRDACLRFARQLGLIAKRPYRKWSAKETENLLQLCESHPLPAVALKLQRPQGSIRGMLDRLGASARLRKDSFTKYVLAALLHARPQFIQRWVDKGWLPAHTEGTEKLPRVVIMTEDFVQFCKKHPDAVLQGRVRDDRLEFVFKFVYPRSHVDLLPVRQAKKERAAYAARARGDDGDFELETDFMNFKESGDSLGSSV